MLYVMFSSSRVGFDNPNMTMTMVGMNHKIKPLLALLILGLALTPIPRLLDFFNLQAQHKNLSKSPDITKIGPVNTEPAAISKNAQPVLPEKKP